MRRGHAIPIAALVLAFSACTTATDPAKIALVTVLPSVDSVEVGYNSTGFSVTLKDPSGSDITGRLVTWSSGNTDIATVDTHGVVHGVASGQTTITATVDGKSASAVIKVLIPVASILMVPDSMNLPLTTQRTISAQLIGPLGQAIVGRRVDWASADPSIATVNSAGTVTPVALGTTNVTATAGSQVGTTKVLVVPEPAVQARIFPEDPVQIVRLNLTKQLSAICYNQSGDEIPGHAQTWTTNNPSVVSVNNSGLVAGLALGSGTITVDCGGPKASVTMQVTLVPVSTASINSTGLTMLVGQQQQLSVTAKDSAGNVLSLAGRNVNWTSDNLPVATVSQAGVVSAVSAGTANVQVSFPNDGVTTAPVPVTVQLVPVALVTVSPANVTLSVSNSGAPSSVVLNVTLKDANGNNLSAAGRTITWQSSNSTVASVSPSTGAVVTVSAVSATNTVTITVTCEGVTGTAMVTVNP